MDADKRRLPPGELHLWRATLPQSAAELDALQALLAPDELARAQRYRQEADHRRFILGRGLLRRLLGHYLNVAPTRICFVYNAHGKPELEESGISFNLSHSGQLVLAAFSAESRLGVDVELLRPMPDGERVAERFFAPGECAALKALPPELWLAGFYRCWTRKEALIKAMGAGLSQPLDEFEVSLAQNEPARLLSISPASAMSGRHWWLANVEVGREYAAAAATVADQEKHVPHIVLRDYWASLSGL